MNFDLTPDQQFFHETTRKFLDATMPTTAVRALGSEAAGFDRAWWQRGAELGWTSLLVDPEHGGGSLSGDGLADLVIVAEELGRHVAPGPLGPCNLAAAAISRFADDATRSRWLPGLLDGSVVGAVVPLPGAAINNGVVTGRADIVEAAAQADVLVVVTDNTIAVVALDAAGCAVTPRNGLDLVKRFGRVELAGTAVTATAASADDAAWLKRVATVLQCAEVAGAVARVFEFTLEYSFDRHSFGRPLASYQALKHRFADMKMHVEVCHALTDRAVRAASGDDRDDADRVVSAAKAYLATYAPEVVQDCVQMHGGIGVTWEHDLHLYLRRVAVLSGVGGDANHHRRTVGEIMARRHDGEPNGAVA